MIEKCTTPVSVTTNTYEPNRNHLDKKQNLGGTNISTFDYTANAIAQRTDLSTTGTAFTEGTPTLAWGYNARGEVIDADHNDNLFDKSYDFDGIGNRLTSTENLTGTPATTTYAPNQLNQYTTITPPTGAQAQTHDADGNTTTTRLPIDTTVNSTLQWNAENRLTQVMLLSGESVYTSHDHMGRRFHESHTDPTTSPATVTHTYWLYDGYNAIAEYTRPDSSQQATLERTHTWGTDLSLTPQGAGGVGGLLATHISGSPAVSSYYPQYDGNGNITDYLSSTGTLAAHYQYDAFDQTLATHGPQASSLFCRFSTKPLTHLGTYYYNYRHFTPLNGRWLNRDPIEEQGGLNLSQFVGNRFQIDFLGRDHLEICGPLHPLARFMCFGSCIKNSALACAIEISKK